MAAVAYADWQRANAPPVEDVVEFAIGHRFEVLLIDTWRKDGLKLLDWVSPHRLAEICDAARRVGVRLALAGSLDLPQIRLLQPVRPDWFAVRGAVCVDGRRESRVEERRVRRLVAALTDRMGTHEKEQPCETP